jgi:TolB protein
MRPSVLSRSVSVTLPTAALVAVAGCAGAPLGGPAISMRSDEHHSARDAAAPAPGARASGADLAADDDAGEGDRDVHFAYGEVSLPAKSAGSSRSFGATAHDPHASLVGLYGELVERPSAEAAGRFDGSGNLAQITTASDGACFDPDTSPDGKMVAFASTQHRVTSDIFVKPADGRTITQVTADPADDVMPAFSPDGSRLSFASNRDGNWNIYVTSIDGGPAEQITDSTEHELHPSWSPDGTKLVLCRLGAQSGRWELWVVDARTRTQQFLDYGLFPHWNPDPARSKIVFQRARDRGSRLFSVWTLDYVGDEGMHPTEVVSAANAAAMHPSWSPDGTRIAFVTVVDPDRAPASFPSSDVWVVNADGTGRANLTNGRFRNLYPEWAPDGSVYFLSDRSGNDNIWAVAGGALAESGDAHEMASGDDDHAHVQDQH